MTALRHLRAAFWDQAAGIRDEWESHGTAAGPSDQDTAEQSLAEVYARIGRPRPEFVWVDSPREAQSLVAHLPSVQDLYRWAKSGVRLPIAGDVATALSRLRGRMDERISTPWFDPKPPKRKKGEEWPDLSAVAALDYGIPTIDIVREHVRESLFKALAHGFYLPAKRGLGLMPGPVCWYGQQEAHWIAYYDVWRRTGLAKYEYEVDEEFETWQRLARSAGWFWPDERVCVVSRRPVHSRTFADGWSVEL